MKKYLSTALTIVILAAFGIYLYFNIEKFEPLTNVNAISLIIVGSAHTFMMLSNALFLKVMLDKFKVRIPVLDSFNITVLSTIGNYFTPFRGGIGVRAVYLKKNFKLKYSRFVSTIFGTYIVVFMINSLAGILGLFLIQQTTDKTNSLLYLFFILLFASTVFLSLVKLPKLELNIKFLKPVFKIVNRIQTGWETLAGDYKTLVQLSALTVLNIVIALISTWIEFNAIGVNLSLPSLILYVAISSTSLLVSITPGSLGIREAILALFSNVMNITNEQVLQVAVIDRAVVFVVLAALYVFLKIFISIEKKSKKN